MESIVVILIILSQDQTSERVREQIVNEVVQPNPTFLNTPRSHLFSSAARRRGAGLCEQIWNVPCFS